MSSSRIALYDALVLIGLGTLGATLAGFFSGSLSVFDMQSLSVQYLLYGGVCAFLFALYRKLGLIEAMYFAGLLSLLLSVLVRDHFVERLGHLTFFLTLACFSYYILWRFLGSVLPFGKFLPLGLSFGIVQYTVTPFLARLLENSSFDEITVPGAYLMGILGFGLGIGLETAEVLLHLVHGGAQHRTV